ncbi:hypothetical protein D3C80_677770 [compost metagenome]
MRAIRVAAVEQQVATDGLVFLGDFRFIQIIELILWQKIVFLQHILIEQGVIAGIKSGLGYGRITDTIDDDKAAVATGPRDPADAATPTCGRRPAGCGGFKVLGRVDPLQDGFLQGRNFWREVAVLGR